jgi:predicted S18 family serine protease
MHRKLMPALLTLVLAAAPAFAATEYFVAQKASDKTCSVVKTKPDGKTDRNVLIQDRGPGEGCNVESGRVSEEVNPCFKPAANLCGRS